MTRWHVWVVVHINGCLERDYRDPVGTGFLCCAPARM